ncbi:MAG: hypothetical protein A4E24_01079 [Methanomethylovorans sp. PtaU1.Bin093]|uniref:hypothetical protein n=1 Tax=Methanomethylovorans sp. PtaU1.Bin093 TaxID=1811679 RepID=UPI0009D2E94D|nr:hypothetical protein [Methanomethylovorans sp. PtaU1.Bin093]OPY20580.1 MAG: hypothetical protein A4E24_01079 [Methanomethylovorans sp. PtaU1.Bin093]
MVKFRCLVIIAVLLCGVVVSGCADKGTTDGTSDETEQISVADNALNEEMIGITDAEIQDMEAQLAELEQLVEEANLEEDIVIEEI